MMWMRECWRAVFVRNSEFQRTQRIRSSIPLHFFHSSVSWSSAHSRPASSFKVITVRAQPPLSGCWACSQRGWSQCRCKRGVQILQCIKFYKLHGAAAKTMAVKWLLQVLCKSSEEGVAVWAKRLFSNQGSVGVCKRLVGDIFFFLFFLHDRSVIVWANSCRLHYVHRNNVLISAVDGIQFLIWLITG